MMRAMCVEVQMANGHVIRVSRESDGRILISMPDKGVVPMLTVNEAAELSEALHSMTTELTAMRHGQKKDPAP